MFLPTGSNLQPPILFIVRLDVGCLIISDKACFTTRPLVYTKVLGFFAMTTDRYRETHPLHFAPVAQWKECLATNQEVASSNPWQAKRLAQGAISKTFPGSLTGRAADC